MTMLYCEKGSSIVTMVTNRGLVMVTFCRLPKQTLCIYSVVGETEAIYQTVNDCQSNILFGFISLCQTLNCCVSTIKTEVIHIGFFTFWKMAANLASWIQESCLISLAVCFLKYQVLPVKSKKKRSLTGRQSFILRNELVVWAHVPEEVLVRKVWVL